MVFSTTNLLKGISCPEGEKCTLTNCIFGHDLRPEGGAISAAESIAKHKTKNLPDSDVTGEPATKRRRITFEHVSDKPPSKAEQIRADLAASRKPGLGTAEKGSHSPKISPGNLPPSLKKPVSPPLTSVRVKSDSGVDAIHANNSEADNSKASALQTGAGLELPSIENLNPRLIPNDPAGHAKRSLFLKHLHGELVRLNQQVNNRPDLEDKRLLFLSEHELVKMALDEEEKVAREQPLIYANVIKQRVALYRKMEFEEWIKHVIRTFDKECPTPDAKDVKPIQTDLTSEEELLILPHLVSDQTKLTPFGYIPTPPTEAQAAEAMAAVEASKHYETCDRCSGRFQVFPERNEDGLLTSNGPCKFHPNRKAFPPKTKGDIAMGHLKEPYYPCCNNIVGSPGCTEHEYHVFKSNSPARLAAVLPFVTTPENDSPRRDKRGRKVKAVSFDCEMGYTVYGMELIRLTAVAWPSGEELVDVLVRPLGTVIDLNSKFSGVWPEHFTNAAPYDGLSSLDNSTTIRPTLSPSSLAIVKGPQQARNLLCSFLAPSTPLIGHAIDNDLNTVRLCHPTIIDTVLLYPHPRGLPYRFGLKALASQQLDRKIQTGGDRGHDSLEDARATGDLVRRKVGDTWKVLSAKGWRIKDGELVPPSPLRGQVNGNHLTAWVQQSFAPGKKRRPKTQWLDGAADDSTEDEKVELGNGIASSKQRAHVVETEAEDLG